MLGIRERILIVDDQQDLLETLLLDYENDKSKQCFLARNGKEALDILAQFSVHLVLTDLKMPLMDGLTLCQKIREQGHQCSLAIITGDSKITNYQDLFALGVEDYIVKPCSAGEVRTRLQKILDRRFMHEAEGFVMTKLLGHMGLPEDDYMSLDKEEKVQVLEALLTRLSGS